MSETTEGQAVAVDITHVMDEVGQTEVWIHQLSPRERSLRALKMLAICWGLALVAVLMPVLHFVLVPGFLIVGPIAGWLAWRRTESLMGGMVVCPKCSQSYDVGDGGVQWPLQAQCTACRAVVSLSPTQAESGESASE